MTTAQKQLTFAYAQNDVEFDVQVDVQVDVRKDEQNYALFDVPMNRHRSTICQLKLRYRFAGNVVEPLTYLTANVRRQRMIVTVVQHVRQGQLRSLRSSSRLAWADPIVADP